MNGESALMCLKATPPEIHDVTEAIEDLVENAMHARAILNNLRSLFGEQTLTRERVDLNTLRSRGTEDSEPVLAKIPTR